MPRVRKLQDPVLLEALEGALASGEPLNSALARFGIHRSTLTRESKRDEGVRQRLERALIAGRTVSETTTRRATKSSTSPTPNEPALDTEVRVVPAVAAGAPRTAPVAADASQAQHHRFDDIGTGTGRVVFGSRRPQPLARVRRIALHGAKPRTDGSNAPNHEGLALHNWLPALLVLIANVALALAASSDLLVVAVVVLVAAAYISLIRWLSRARLASPPGSGTAHATGGPVRRDLAWLQDTIGEPMLGEQRPPPPRDRTDG
ncbi:MAG: hypothetical protein M3406_10310 [Chloroflexota bacterium]|nr:hypothetical protein [Chloroflexota bacterium]